MAKEITKIPATLNRFNLEPVVAIRKRRVAGYARVSTDHDEQATSYEAQMAYYKAYIENREDWEEDRFDYHKVSQPICTKYGRFPFYHPKIEGKRCRGIF